MEKHNGKILETVLETKRISVEKLAFLLQSNIMTVKRLLDNADLSWDNLSIIGRVIGHDLSLEFPGLAAQEVESYKITYNISEQVSDFFDVFLIEDSEMDVKIFRIILNRALGNIKVAEFTNGESALSNLLDLSINYPSRLPKHIFLDLKMPVMDGTRFLEHFHRLNIDPEGNIKIHVLSSSIFISEKQKFMANPLVSRFISKPIEIDDIKSIFEIKS